VLIEKTALSGVLVLTPRVFTDPRGSFCESFNVQSFAEAIGTAYDFVQDNHSISNYGVLRGLHYQLGRPQGKLVRVVEGAVFDVAVDIRIGSPSYGKWTGVELTAENNKQLWIPPDFAHGFLVMSSRAQVMYKATDFYCPESERSIAWNDKALAIGWPEVDIQPIVSSKDEQASSLRAAELPRFAP
jgi:dTDP-4-dehydrorhamnose 3,5-epimerase